jgi:hypothetical protein
LRRLLNPLATLTAIAVFIGMRLWRITDMSLDGDEIFSLEVARHNWHDLFQSAIQDAIHPPLLYVLLKPWIAIGGDSLLWLRLFPVLASILCLIPVFFLCRNLKISAAARNLAIVIVAVHPYALFNAQHLRMYAMLMLLGLVSAWRFQEYLDSTTRRNLAILAVVNVFLVYTQYYAWCIVGLEFIYLVWRRRNIFPFLVSALPAAILFAPWAYVAGQVLHARGLAQNLGWIQRPTFGELNWFWVDLTGFAEFPSISAGGEIAVLVIFLIAYRRAQETDVHWLMLLWIAPAPLAFIASQYLPQSIWGHRHLLFAIWPFVILFADSVCRMPKWFSIPVIALTGVWAIGAAQFHAHDNRKLPYDTLTIEMLDADLSTSNRVPIYAIDPYLHYPIGFYLDGLRTGRTGPFGPHLGHRDLTAKAARFDSIKTDSIDQVKGSYFWVGYTDSSWRDPKTPVQLLEQRGCHAAGPELSERDAYHRAILVPIECK